MRIDIQVIPHHAQRYPTCGDYFEFEGIWNFRVSKMSDSRYEILVFIHELIEWSLIRAVGITVEEIDAFDMEYENNRQEGDVSEPGNDPKAPYHYQHRVATIVERLAAHFMGVRWEDYEKEVDSL